MLEGILYDNPLSYKIGKTSQSWKLPFIECVARLTDNTQNNVYVAFGNSSIVAKTTDPHMYCGQEEFIAPSGATHIAILGSLDQGQEIMCEYGKIEGVLPPPPPVALEPALGLIVPSDTPISGDCEVQIAGDTIEDGCEVFMLDEQGHVHASFSPSKYQRGLITVTLTPPGLSPEHVLITVKNPDEQISNALDFMWV